MRAVPLTKSLFQSGRQCRKRLWLEVHRRDLMEWSASAQARAKEGTRLGELARKQLGLEVDEEWVEVPDSDFDKALVQTYALLAELPIQRPVLFEAAFEHEGVRVRVDALMRFLLGDRLIEVKSGTKPTEDYLWDCALQAWVLRGAGRPVHTVSLDLVDTGFVYAQEGDYRGLLTLDDYTEQVEALLPQVPTFVAEFKAVMAGLQPDILTGRHCNVPYECPFLRHCRLTEPPAPAYPIEDLPYAKKSQISRLKASGYTDLRDVPDDLLKNPLQHRAVQAARSGEVFVSADFAAALDGIPYPRYYLDFETIAFTVPRWLGTRPYQQVPFQFSCHVEQADGRLEHRAFLDLTGDNPASEFVAALLAAIGEEGSILVWNKTFEISRLRELAVAFPQHAESLLGFVKRIVDLMKIYKEHYYHRDMHGSWSIKNVLPTIAPDLDYGTLEVSDGNEAQDAYRRAIAPETSEAERETIRRNLLDYCERDTYAMVRLARWRGESKASYEVRHQPICSKCGELYSFIHLTGFAFAVETTRATLHDDRLMRGSWVSVCPICDAYLLMREFAWGVPFYSERDMAVVSIADYGGEVIAPLLEFGNLPFTPNALRGALEMSRKRAALKDADRIERLDRSLLGPTGIPDDDSVLAEWNRQLELLASQLPESPDMAELDAAVRTIVRQVPAVEN